MMKFVKLIAAAVLPALLSGCLLIPGKFDSTMDIRRDGNFSFAYKGEVVFQLPDDKMMLGETGKPKTWSDKMAVCWSDDNKEVDEFGVYDDSLTSLAESGTTAAAPPVLASAKPPEAAPPAEKPAAPVTKDAKEAAGKASGKASKKAKNAAEEAATKAAEAAGEAAEADAEAAVVESESTIRKCTKAEVTELKTEWLEKQTKEREQAKLASDMMGRIIGIDPTRPETMTRFAEDLMKQAGWRSVVYKGNGIFIVDYLHQGSLDQDFVFPVLPEQQIMIPFVTIKRRADGAALVETPGYSLMSNGGLIGGVVAMSEAFTNTNPLEKAPYNPLKNIAGKFTITTDGEFLTNNSVDGPSKVATGKAVSWKFREARDPAPKALVGLK
jgi:uncharacterized protein YjbJ (UPF0337 family)